MTRLAPFSLPWRGKIMGHVVRQLLSLSSALVDREPALISQVDVPSRVARSLACPPALVAHALDLPAPVLPAIVVVPPSRLSLAHPSPGPALVAPQHLFLF